MGKEYEIKFKLDAETDSSFSKAFSSASSDFKQLQAQVSDISRGRGVNKGLLGSLLDPLRRNMRQTQADAKKTASAAENMFGLIKKAGVGIAGFLAARNVLNLGKDFIQTFATFEQGMANVRAVSGLGKTSKDFELLTAKAREMGERTSKTASEAADGLQYLALAGWNTEQMLAGIEPVLRLSEAGAMDLGRASDLATDSMAALGLEVQDLPAYLDKVAQASRRSNTSVEQLMDAFLIAGGSFKTFKVPLEEATSLLGTLANRGFKGSEAGTAMNAIITNLTSGLGQSGKAMKELELSAFDAKGNFKGLEQVFRDVKAKLDPMTDAQKAQYISMIAGKEHLKTFTGILDGLGNEYGNLKKEVSSADGALMEMAETQMDTLSGSMKLMESAFESAKISLGEKFAPTVRRVVDDITTWIPQAMGELESLMDGPAWQNADILGKAKLAWDKIIGEPLAAWWDSSGRQQVAAVTKEIAKMVWSGISGLAKESLGALSGSPTGILAAGALAIPATKVTKGAGKIVKSLSGMSKAGAGAASSMGIVARSAGLVGPAIAALANPIGLAVAGIGALAGGWYLYRKHQEKARQDLIRMGDSLKKSLSDYSAVENQTQKTKDLITEYNRLKAKIADSATPAAQLTEAKRKLRDVEKELIEMYPEMLSYHDIENGKLDEKIGKIDRLTDAQREEAKLKLEQEIANSYGRKDDLEKEIVELREKRITIEVDKEQLYDAHIAFLELENEYRRIMQMDESDDRTRMLEDLRSRVNEAGKGVGEYFEHLGGLLGTSERIHEKYADAVNSLVATSDELKVAEESYQQLYDAQNKMIQLNLGAKLEEQSKKFNQLSSEEKKRFDEALTAAGKLNAEMRLLPTDKKINLEVIWKESGKLKSNFDLGTSIIQKDTTPSFPSFGLKEYADGGFSNQPSIFGEAGMEVAIPINNKQRSHDLLEKTNRIMGHTGSGGGNEINVTWAPQITVQGGANVKQDVSEALNQAKGEFERWFQSMMRQQGRVSMR